MSEERRPDDLPELPDPELTELAEVPAPAPSAPPAPPSSAARRNTGRPPRRILDRAPTHLRTAALLVLFGASLPFLGVGDGWLVATGAKACALAAAGLWWAQVLHDFGPEQSGVLGGLASFAIPLPARLRRKPARRTAGGPFALEHPFPTALHAFSLALIAFAVVLSLEDERKGVIGSKGLSEMAIFGWAAFTWVHIASYERWGRFNPLFPLLFLGMLFAGLASVLGALDGEGAGKLAGLLGGGAVAAGGGLAAYTIVEAMLQAKKEGDRKKANALEARKAARRASREAQP